MSRAEIERFAAAVSADPALRADVGRIASDRSAGTAERIVVVARAHGVSLTVDNAASLSDADLEQISGGSFVISTPEPLASAARDLPGIGEVLGKAGG